MTEPKPTNGEGIRPRSFHDDPIVIDNPALKIDLAHLPTSEPGGKKWKRAHHGWDYIAVMQRLRDGTFFSEVHQLHKNRPVTLDLVDMNNSRKSTTVEFVPTHGDLEMRDRGDREFKLSGRWLETDDKLRIVDVTAYGPDNKPLPIKIQSDPDKTVHLILRPSH